MLTIKLFDGWVRSLARRPLNRDIENWARIEYKKDSVFAYHYMLEHGIAPSTGAI